VNVTVLRSIQKKGKRAPIILTDAVTVKIILTDLRFAFVSHTQNLFRNVAPTFHSTQNWTTNLHCRDAIINRIPFHSLEAGAFDHLDDLLLGHLHFVVGFDRVRMREFAAIGDGAVKVVGAIERPASPAA
jgi:hypothetical protein